MVSEFLFLLLLSFLLFLFFQLFSVLSKMTMALEISTPSAAPEPEPAPAPTLVNQSISHRSGFWDLGGTLRADTWLQRGPVWLTNGRVFVARAPEVLHDIPRDTDWTETDCSNSW